jgi:uncharacterized membrane protein YoaK (UPF0700 family)
MQPEPLRVTAAALTAVTFVAGASVGYHVARRHAEPERLLVAAVAGVIAVPVLFVTGAFAKARALENGLTDSA